MLWSLAVSAHALPGPADEVSRWWERLVGEIGAPAARRSRDADGDGFDDKTEACPGQAETRNGYRDDDGCPDTMPQIEFVARRGEADEPLAALIVTAKPATGNPPPPTQAMGRVVATGMPGTVYSAVAKIGACFGGTAEAKIPAEGSLVVPIDIGRQDATVSVSVTDAVGRPLEGAEARYLVEDDACAPYDTEVTAGKAVHTVGAGPVTVFLTAPGYGVLQEAFTLTPGQREIVDARLAPTQVALREGVFRLAKPLQFGSGTAILGATSNQLLGQVASLMMSNDGQKFQITAYAPAGDGASRLSKERAAAVVAQLVSLGVPAESLVGVGKGALPSSQKEYVTIKVIPGE
jgi:outer membrane protein OmpA-like peptidoglycan-associated protein